MSGTKMLNRRTYKSNVEMLTILVDRVNGSPPVFQEHLRSLYERNELVTLHHTFGQIIRNEFRLWDPLHPVHILWTSKGMQADSQFHPDQYSMQMIKDVCLNLFGVLETVTC